MADIDTKNPVAASASPKVLHFIDSGGFYGAEKVIVCLAQETLKDGSYNPIIGCIVQNIDESVALANMARSLGIEAVAIVINNKRLPIDIIRAAKSIQRLRIDLIHSHGYKPSVFGYLISKLIRVPILATCHLWFSGSRPPLKYRVMTWLEVFLYRYFRRVVCVSPQIKNLLRGRGIKEHQLEVIDNGIDVDTYTKSVEGAATRVRQTLSLSSEEFVVLNVGRLTEQKGQKKIIALAEAMREKGIEVVFLIAGEGEQRGLLESLITERKLENRVKLLGFREDIGSLLCAADVFFLPSLDEGLPMSLLEAMASGVPVVATPVGAIPQLVENGISGLLVNPGDLNGMYAALIDIRQNRHEAHRLATNALRTVRRTYSSESMYQNYKRIYEELGVCKSTDADGVTANK